MRPKPYLLINGASREIYMLAASPTLNDFPGYSYAIGPFRTKRGAKYMAEHGRNNLLCVTVSDAERLAQWKGKKL